MRVTIDGEEVGPNRLGPPAMNYGQLHRWRDYREVAYEYVTSVEEFVSILSSWFETYRVEIRADDKMDPPESGSADAEYVAAGYPTLSELIDKYPELLGRLLPGLGLEINNAFGSREPDSVRYAVNSVDWVRVDGDDVRLGGVAFDMREKGAP